MNESDSQLLEIVEVLESNPKIQDRCEIPMESLKALLPNNDEMALAALGDKHRLGLYIMQSLSKCLQHLQTDSYRSCVSLADMLLDLVWEKLNTGHWKNVALEWRHAYTLCSAVKAYGECGLNSAGSQTVSRSTIMKTLDMGLLMGAPLWDNILAKMCGIVGQATSATQTPSELTKAKAICSGDCDELLWLCHTGDNSDKNFEQSESHKSVHCRSESESKDAPVKKRKTIDYPEIDQDRAIPRISCPSIEHFQREYWSQRKPVIITDAIDFWPALTTRRWSLDYIRQVAGCRTVPIELGSKYTEDSWTQALMTIDSFIDRYIEHPEDSTVGYLAQHQLFEQVPELMRDFSIPAYCSVGADPDSDPDINAWFGPSGTVSPLHYDDKHNLLTQVKGEKYIRLYAPAYTDHLYPHSSHLLFNTSQVDVECMDVERFPLFPAAPYTECVLREREMLYMPPGHWHFVKSLAPSFSISFWWQEAPAEELLADSS